MGKTVEKNENGEYPKGDFVNTCDKNIKLLLSAEFSKDLSLEFEEVSRLVEIKIPRVLWNLLDEYGEQAKIDKLITEGLYKILFDPSIRKDTCISMLIMIKKREEKCL